MKLFISHLSGICFALLSLASSAAAQIEYTYVSDKVFGRPDELLNYTFVPNEEQGKDDRNPRRINPGTIEITMTPGALKIKEFGSEEPVSFNMVSINPQNYGYKAELINAQNPSEQGHLKIILNDLKQVDVLVLKRSRQAPELMYFQSYITEKISQRDDKYFTDISDYTLQQDYFLFNQKRIKPFFQSDAHEKKRIYPKDSISFRFYEKMDGKKKFRMVRFQFLDKSTESEEVSDMEYVITKASDIEYERNGATLKGYEFVLKDFPGKTMAVFLNEKFNMVAIQFGATFFDIRDKKVHGYKPPK